MGISRQIGSLFAQEEETEFFGNIGPLFGQHFLGQREKALTGEWPGKIKKQYETIGSRLYYFHVFIATVLSSVSVYFQLQWSSSN